MKSLTKILTINSDGKCEKIQLFPKLTDEFQITEIEFESLNSRTITKEKEEIDDTIYYDEYGQRFQRSTHISEIETFSRDKVVYKIIETTVTRIYFDGTAETVESIQIDRCPDENSFFKIRRELKEFTYNENHQISKIKTTNSFINKDDVSYMVYSSTKDLISSEIKDDELIEKYKTIKMTDKIDVISEKVFDKYYTPDYNVRKEYITTDIFDNDTKHQISHEIKNQDNKVVHSEKYNYVIDTNCHTSRIKRTLLDKNGKISKVIYEDYDDELFDKITLHQELINNFNFKGDKKITIIYRRKYSYDNDGDIIFIDQEKTVRSKTEKSQQIFIY